jgi:hypothetical protein
MDEVVPSEEIERRIEATMREQGVDRAEAIYQVALKYGEWHGDLVFLSPLTDEQRRRLSMPLHEVMRELGELDDDFNLPGDSTDTTIAATGDRVAD